MTDKNIADLIAQVVTAKQEASVDLTECPNEFLPGRVAAKNSALQKSQELATILRGVIGGYSGAIFVSGPGAKQFAAIAEDEAPALVLDAAELYTSIASVWFPTVRVDKVFAVDCMPAFILALQSTLPPLGVRSMAPPDFSQRFGTPINSFEDAVALTRNVLRATVGDDLNGLYLTDKLTQKVIAEEWNLKFITVVVLNATTDETHAGTLFNGLCNGRNIEVNDVPENVDINDVIVACKHLRAKVTGKPISPTQTNETDQTNETSPDSDKSTPKRKYTRKPTQ